jgi:hypothetical protein
LTFERSVAADGRQPSAEEKNCCKRADRTEREEMIWWKESKSLDVRVDPMNRYRPPSLEIVHFDIPAHLAGSIEQLAGYSM